MGQIMTLLLIFIYSFGLTAETQDSNRSKYHPGYYEQPHIATGMDSVYVLLKESLQDETVAIQTLKDTIIVSLRIEYPGVVRSVQMLDSANVPKRIREKFTTVFCRFQVEYPDTSGGYPPNIWLNIPIIKRKLLY